MKKTLLVLLSVLLCSSVFAQQGVATAPAVTITATAVTSDSFSAHFEPNAECSHFYYVTLTDEDINLWTAMMGMSLDQIIPMWGINATAACDYTWTEMAPNTTYKIFALPYDAQEVPYSYNFIEVTTDAIGGSGTAVISVSVSEITSNSALVVCTPNDQTAMFYDGLITAEYYNEVGKDSACAILVENMPTPYYSTDSWTWPLEAATEYYAIAFGKNSAGEWGDTTIVSFSTLPVGVETFEVENVNIYPMPNNGTFTVAGTGLQGGKAQIYSVAGQMLMTTNLQNDSNLIATELTPGAYFIRIMDKKGLVVSNRTILVR